MRRCQSHGARLLAAATVIYVATASLALADTRRVVFVIEETTLAQGLGPQPQQLLRSEQVSEAIKIRLMELVIQDYISEDGTVLLASSNANALASADVLVQFLPTVSPQGFVVEAAMFNKSTATWKTLTPAIQSDPDKLVENLFRDVVPSMLVLLAELAHPDSRPVLLADCLVPATDESVLSQAGRVFSSRYGTTLKSFPALQKKFAIVKLVPAAAQDVYDWWCKALRVPRKGTRPNTVTISGALEMIADKPALGLELRSSDGAQYFPSDDLIPVDVQEMPESLDRIGRLVEDLANEM